MIRIRILAKTALVVKAVITYRVNKKGIGDKAATHYQPSTIHNVIKFTK